MGGMAGVAETLAPSAVSGVSDGGFRFLDAGPFTDGELLLVAPAAEWLEDILASCTHPLTVRETPAMGRAKYTREQVRSFINANPLGHERGDPVRGKAPAYHFLMIMPSGYPLRIAGGIGLRIGQSRDLEMYMGHIGYHVYPAMRGHHLAERACRLLLPLARAHGLAEVWITCNPENIPSRRTCERLGAQLVEVVAVPQGHDLWQRGEHRKCRYRVVL